MILNKYSYVHKQIRALCFILEQSTGLKLATDLDKDFKQIQFISNYSSITIDFEKNTIFIMMLHLSINERKIVEDLLLHTRWLYIGSNHVTKM